MQIIQIEHFSDFLRRTLDKKLDIYLEKLFSRFSKFHHFTNQMIELLVILHGQLEIMKHKDLDKIKQQINNSLYYLNQFYSEIPSFIAWNYCEKFQTVAQERLSLIRANIHPLFHQLEDASNRKHIFEQLYNIEEKCNQILQQVKMVNDEINNNEIILKQKEEISNKYNDKLDYLINSHYKLNEDSDFIKYYTLYQQLNKLQNHKPLDELIQLITSLLNINANIIQLLEIPITYAKLTKQQNKKAIKGNNHELQLIMKYSSILISKDQIYQQLSKSNSEDIYEYIKLMEKQQFIRQPQQLFVQQFNQIELKNLFILKESKQNNLLSLIKKQDLVQEWNNTQILQQVSLQQLFDIIPQIISHLANFVRTCQIYRQIQKDVTVFFQQNFQMNVQLEFAEFEQFNVM